MRWMDKETVSRVNATEQTPTCSIFHIFHLHHLRVDSASEHIERPVDRLGPLGGLLSRNPWKRGETVVTNSGENIRWCQCCMIRKLLSAAYAHSHRCRFQAAHTRQCFYFACMLVKISAQTEMWTFALIFHVCAPSITQPIKVAFECFLVFFPLTRCFWQLLSKLSKCHLSHLDFLLQ